MKTRRSTKEIKSEPVDEEQPQAVSSSVIKKEEAREEQKEPEEKCLVCYKQITNPSRLDTCNHPICVECMKLWLEHAMSCCTCRAEPKDHVIVNEGRPNEYTISITEIVRTKERRQRLEAGQSVPLTLERAIIRKAKHEYQAEIERINNTAPIAHRGRGAVRRPQNDQRKRYRELVEAQNVLNVLLDETDRKNIVSNRHFRKLIYQYNCRWYSASEGIGTSYTPNNVRENDEAEAERLRPFIQKELDFVNYVRFGAFRTKRARDDMAKTIFSRLKDMPIHTPTLHTMLVVELGIDMRHAERLQHELFSFAASRLSEEEFYAISCYKLPNVVGQLNDFAVGGLNQMPQQQPPAVVTLDDEPMTIEDDDDVMVVESLSTPRVLSESNYVREEHRESPDRDAALYARPGCLVNFAAPAFFPHSAIQYTNFGFGVPEISTRFSHRPPPQLAAPPQIAQVFTIDDTSEPDTAEAAIVLDDGPSSSGGGAQERPKRPFESQSQQEPILLDDSCCTEPSQDSQQDDDDDGRFSKRKADRHQKGLEKQIRRMRETQDFRSMISWMNEQTRKMETEMRGRGEQPPVFRTRSGSTRRGEERGGARRYPRHGTDHRPSSRRH